MQKQQIPQVLATIHASMLANGWAMTRSESEAEQEVREYAGAAVLEADGSSIWGNTSGVQVHVQNVVVVCYKYDDATDTEEHGASLQVGWTHACNERGSCMLYTDAGLAASASALLGHSISWTEQGMQDDYYMSME
jgi:hypothetical protein